MFYSDFFSFYLIFFLFHDSVWDITLHLNLILSLHVAVTVSLLFLKVISTSYEILGWSGIFFIQHSIAMLDEIRKWNIHDNAILLSSNI